MIGMKALTINLSDDLDQRLRAMSTRERRSPEETAEEILRRRLMLDRFHDLCRESEALARAAGFTSEEDILRAIS
jgi:predicted transcriptional regulator